MMKRVTCIEDLRLLHMKRVPKAFFDYADRGSYTEDTLRANRADLEDTRTHYAALYPNLPYPPLDGYRQALEELVETNPRAADYRLADAVDDRFVREIEASGLERQLYGR